MGRSRLIPALILFGALAVGYSGPRDSSAGQVRQAEKIVATQKLPQAAIDQNPGALVPDYGKIPLYFIPNQGQVDAEALFYAKTSRYTLWMTNKGLVFDAAIRERDSDNLDWKKRMLTEDPEALLQERLDRETAVNIKRDVSRVVFLGANKQPRLSALEPTENRVNYFIGNDRAKWKTNIPSSRAVLYEDLYPGIDLKVYGVESRVEYDWIIKPGARVEDIRFEYQDVSDSRIDERGDLVVETIFGQLSHHKPISYQWIGVRKVEVLSEFKEVGKNIYGFKVGGYDHAHALTIDPILIYSTYLGGSGDDFATDIAVDKTAAAYVVGYTTSADFPLKGSFQNKNKGNPDVFVAKFAPSGNALVYSTFLGGSSIDEAYGIAVDSSGAAYVTGETWSSDFPLQNPLMSIFIGCCTDVFVTKISPAGNALAYSSYLNAFPGAEGLNYWDRGRDIAVDSSGAAYVTGWTNSTNFPLVNPFQSTASCGVWNGFVTKFTPAGNALVYSTYLGGTLHDGCWGIAVDSAGSAYVTGWTDSPDFPLQNPYQKKLAGEADAYVAKFSPTGNALIYSTYLGGSSMEWPYSIAVDGLGAAYIIGETYSDDFPVKNAFQKARAGNLDLFITKLAPSGLTPVFSTYFGGSYWEEAGDIAVDNNGNVYVTGETGSINFPFQNPYQKITMNGDAFVTKFMPAGNVLAYSMCLGGYERDKGTGVAVDSRGAVYVAGWTHSSDFPLRGPYQKLPKGSWDSFLAKLDFSSPAITLTSPDGGETWKAGSTQTVKWDFTGKTGASVKIELLKGTKANAIIEANAAIGKNGKGSYGWKVPSGQAAGSDYRIRITSARYKTPSDTSNAAFTISH